jgi:signal transduction histidine kinase
MQEMSTTSDIVDGIDPAAGAGEAAMPAKRGLRQGLLIGTVSAQFRNLPDWLRTALLVVFVLTAVGLIHGTADLLFNDRKIPGFITRMMDAWSWALLVPLIIAADRRLPLSENQFVLRVAVHFLLLSIPFVAAHVVLEATAEFPIESITWNPFRSHYETYYYFYGGWVSYLAIACALLSFRYYEGLRTTQLQVVYLETQLLQAHLHNLRMQLEPHFMMNALNAVSSEVESNPTLARQIIEDVGVLLRVSHEYKDRQLIPLFEEMALLDHYLAIQKVRFGDRLKIEARIAPDAKFVRVPSLLLQPLVENAIRHGLEGTKSGGTIRLLAHRVGSEAEIRVEDDGVGLPSGWKMEASSGQGLAITRERLAALYPKDAARIVVRPRQGGGTEVLVSLPVQTTVQTP